MQGRKSKNGVFTFGAVLVLGALAAGYLLMSRTGTMVITVAGPGNAPVDGVKVFVDDKLVCEKSPCAPLDLDPGTHLVKVSADGYAPMADKGVKIEAGDETPVNITLAALDNAGVRVAAEGSGLSLIVDGKNVGPLPQEVKGLAPGEHTIKVTGNDRYEPFEQTVNLESSQVLDLQPELKVIKGLAIIEAGDNADGAKIMLVSGSERRQLRSLPKRVDISSDKTYTLVATRKGYQTYEEEVEFKDGKAEKTFVINLTPEDEGTEDAPAARTVAAAPRAPRATRSAAPTRAAPSSKATLNLNSIPASNVILDGRPLGSTPKIGVSVSPGSHTVMFVHPEHGRKSRAVTVQAGKTATAAVRFP